MAENLERVVTGAICANAGVFVWGLVDHQHAEMAEMVEHVILAVFVTEMAIKVWVERLAYFRRPANVFDAVLIALSLLATVPAAGALRLARAARLLKLLHIGRHAVQLRAVVALARRREGVAA